MVILEDFQFHGFQLGKITTYQIHGEPVLPIVALFLCRISFFFETRTLRMPYSNSF